MALVLLAPAQCDRRWIGVSVTLVNFTGTGTNTLVLHNGALLMGLFGRHRGRSDQ